MADNPGDHTNGVMPTSNPSPADFATAQRLANEAAQFAALARAAVASAAHQDHTSNSRDIAEAVKAVGNLRQILIHIQRPA